MKRFAGRLVGGLLLTTSIASAAAAQRPQLTWPDSTSWRHLGPAAFGGRIDDIEAAPQLDFGPLGGVPI